MSNSTNIEVKYLDATGLSILWEKISDTFVRNDDIASIQGVNLMLLDDTDEHILYLYTKKTENGEEKPDQPVSSWNYNEFYTQAIKDGFLKEVSLVTIKENDEEQGQEQEQDPGTYLRFEWNTDAANQVTYVNVTDLTDYTEGDYIKIENGKISVNTVDLVTYLESEEVWNINGIKTKVEQNETDIDALKARVASLESLDFSDISVKLKEHDEAINDINSRLDQIPLTPITQEEINNLGKSPDQSGEESTN